MRLRALFVSLLTVLLAAAAGAPPAAALEGTALAEFHELAKLPPPALAQRAQAVLERKYPHEDWDAYGFPRYVYTQEPTKIAYRVAVKEPDTLAVAVCACFCDEMGHQTLAYCFLKEGKPASGFDDHAVGCNICVRQALLAFLWNDLGASRGEIRKAMGDAFGTP